MAELQIIGAAKVSEGSAMLGTSPALKAYLDRHMERKSVRDTTPTAPPGPAPRT